MIVTSSGVRFYLMALCALTLCACGGGGGGGNNSLSGGSPADTSTYTFSVTAQIRDANGNPQTTLTQGTPATVVARVIETRTQVVSGQTITGSGPAVGANVAFTTSGGALAPGSATTDVNGNAKAILSPGSAAGAFTLNVQVTPPPNTGSSGSTGSVQTSVNYQIGTTYVPTLASLTLLDAHGNPTQTLAAGEIGSVTVKAEQVTTAADGTANGYAPAPNTIVTFASDGGTFDPTNGTALADANGIATVKFQANVVDAPATMTATATIATQAVSASEPFSISVPVVLIGSGAPFKSGTLAVGQASLSAGGRTSVTAMLANADGSPYAPPVSVNFTSGCIAAGTASITTPVISANGTATTTYVAGIGCVGTDTITASAVIPGTTLPLQATGNVAVAPPTAGEIVYVSAVPTTLALRGTGSAKRPEQALVTFTVTSATGVPVPNQKVDFALTSGEGGLALSQTSAISDPKGQVVATVQSGTIPVVFRVVATVDGTTIATQSDQLTVSTGTPDQNGFSISATTLNVEGWNIDGVTSTVNIRASDRYQNPVPDGTTILFTAQGGSIAPNCTTQNGACSVVWTTQAPRPANGRVNILARSLGDESFVDLKGTGQFERGDTWGDLPDPWVDVNENGKWDPGEPYYDLQGGAYQGPNGLYDGLLCNPASGLCGNKSTYVRANIELVMSSSHAVIGINPGTISVSSTKSQPVAISVSDVNGNMMPAGTTVAIATSAGTLSGTTTYTIGNTNARGPFVAQVLVSGTSNATSTSGLLNVTVTAPSGTVSTNGANITDAGTASASVTGTAGLQASSVIANPATVNVEAGSDATHLVYIMATDAHGRFIDGVTPAIECAPAAGISVHVAAAGVSDSASGHPARLAIASAPRVRASTICTIHMGNSSVALPVVVGR